MTICTVTQGANCPGGSFDIIGTTRYYWSAVAVNYDNAMTSCPTDSTLAIFEDTTVMAILAARGNAGTKCNTNLHLVFFCAAARRYSAKLIIKKPLQLCRNTGPHYGTHTSEHAQDLPAMKGLIG